MRSTYFCVRSLMRSGSAAAPVLLLLVLEREPECSEFFLGFNRLDRIRTGVYGVRCLTLRNGQAHPVCLRSLSVFVLDILDPVIAVVVHVRVVGEFLIPAFGSVRHSTAQVRLKSCLAILYNWVNGGDASQYRNPCNKLEHLQRTNILQAYHRDSCNY